MDWSKTHCLQFVTKHRGMMQATRILQRGRRTSREMEERMVSYHTRRQRLHAGLLGKLRTMYEYRMMSQTDHHGMETSSYTAMFLNVDTVHLQTESEHQHQNYVRIMTGSHMDSLSVHRHCSGEMARASSCRHDCYMGQTGHTGLIQQHHHWRILAVVAAPH